MSATVLSSRPSAASGRSWKSLAKALSLKGSGAIFACENRASAQAARGLPATPAAPVIPCAEARAAILDERRFAAEKMRDAGNVEHQPVAPIERGERRKAGAPVAEALQKPRLFRRLRLDRDEGGKARARVGKRKAGGQAQPRGFGVDADEPLRVVDLGDGRERRGFINAVSRRARSVARRGSQRERNRRVVKSQVLVKSQILASPFQTDDARGS